MYGKDFVYAGTRIVDTIVRMCDSGEPVTVLEVGRSSGTCVVMTLTAPEPIRVRLDDLDVRPVRLGYVNYSGNAVYLERIPIRRGPNNQGLTPNNCHSSSIRFSAIPLAAIRQCIMGIYPTFENAIIASSGKKRSGALKSIAFDRSWALNGASQLLYKNHRLVGSVKNNEPVLDKEFSYLKERLMEIL